MSNLQRRLVMANLPPAMPPPGRSATGVKKGSVMGKRDYSPVSWDHYFEKMSDIKMATSDALGMYLNESFHLTPRIVREAFHELCCLCPKTFRVYESGTAGPVCVCLHGGGFSALSWAVLSKILTSLVLCRCTAIDLRGHGDTITTNDEDLSAEVMASDVEKVISKLYGDNPPPIVLIGHSLMRTLLGIISSTGRPSNTPHNYSMGGAIAIHTARRNRLTSLSGLIVIDVVEGTAMEALNSMQTFLRGRPKVFQSIEKAIEYCVRSGQIRNLESARVSMVGQLKRIETNETATAEIEHQLHPVAVVESNVIREEEESETAPAASAASGHSQQTSISSNAIGSCTYSWRIDLSATEKYWRGWFEGLSKSFMASTAPKMLLLAGVDRLDKDLTVGQMQGKFQLQLLPQSGHAVHEDSPDKVADAVATFIVRNRLTTAKESFESAFPGS